MTHDDLELLELPPNQVHELVLRWMENQDPGARSWFASALSPLSAITHSASQEARHPGYEQLGYNFIKSLRALANREIGSLATTEFQIARSVGLAVQLSASLTLLLGQGPDPSADPGLHTKRWQRMCDEWTQFEPGLAKVIQYAYQRRAGFGGT